MKKGLIYVFTGDGKGKTSAALGIVVRAVCNGMKVAWISWYKEKSWDISEKHLPEILGRGLEMFWMGKGFYIKKSKIQNPNDKIMSKLKIKTVELKNGGLVVDHETVEQHKLAAEKALKKAEQLLKSRKYDLLILDEINNVIADKLLDVKKVIELIKQRGKTHLILTGRNASKKLINLADLVTEMKKIKHPYDKGIKALKGLDF